MAHPAIDETPPEVARIDDLADREQLGCTPDPNTSSRRSRSEPRPGALRLLFAQDVASDWWLESQLLFGKQLDTQ
jgi:hypothetical protein